MASKEVLHWRINIETLKSQTTRVQIWHSFSERATDLVYIYHLIIHSTEYSYYLLEAIKKVATMSSEHDYCPNTMCSLLPFGFVLLTSDLFHDLRWCLSPSKENARKLKEYYMAVLTPRLLPIPWPGLLFPLYAIYIFVGMCPDWINWSLFFLYIPLCEKYYRIKQGEMDCLRSWWLVIVIRVLMGILTYKGWGERGCRMIDYLDNFRAFMTYSHLFSSQ